MSLEVRLHLLQPVEGGPHRSFKRRKQVILQNGKTVLGRRDTYFGLADKRISRSHVKITVDPEALLEVVIVPIGTNPCCLKKKWVSIDSVPSFVKDNPQESEASNSDAVEALERNQKYGVDNGDVLFLLPDEYALEFEFGTVSERVECEQDKTTIDSESGELSREEHTTPPEALETSTGSTPEDVDVVSADDDGDTKTQSLDLQCGQQPRTKRKRQMDNLSDDSICEVKRAKKNHPVSPASRLGDYSLAFPPISTGVFQFDPKVAASLLEEVVVSFLALHGNKEIRLTLVDLSEDSLATFLEHCKVNDARFAIERGDITKLSSGGLGRHRFIVNACNHRFTNKGSGVNKAIHTAAGPELYKRTKSQLQGLAEPGCVYPIRLPDTSPLTMNEGVEYVFHTLGPNMNPRRPNCLNGDYETGKEQMRKAFQSMLDHFLHLTGICPRLDLSKSEEKSQLREEPILDCDAAPTNGKRSSLVEALSPRKDAYRVLMEGLRKQQSPPTQQRKRSFSSWSGALLPYVENPEQHPKDVLFYDDQVVVINDKFPKAQRHCLVMPRKIISSFDSLSRSDLPLLQHMYRTAREHVVRRFSSLQPDLRFRVGFHAVPSMRQLHMHVISDDFDSAYLKTKKHWNSFTSPFFVFYKDFVEILNDKGAVYFNKLDYERMLKDELVCIRCKSVHKTMPSLKSHLLLCDADGDKH